MSKKLIYSVLGGFIIMGMFGCGQKAPGSAPATEAVSDVNEVTADGTEPLAAPAVTEPSDQADPEVSEEMGPAGDVDVDLTSLSSTFVYSEVYNMMTNPDDYMGKKICMEGAFSHYHDDTTGKDYYACIIQDATACCSQGIEFELEGEHKYPEDYPEEGATIRVEGVYDTYMEGDSKYCTLRAARFL